VVVVCHSVVIRCFIEAVVGYDPQIVPNGFAAVLESRGAGWVHVNSADLVADWNGR
jgi:broad specificity phosphatase PhoE